MKAWLALWVGLGALGISLSARAAPDSVGTPLVVASKKFPESALLAELLAQALERRGVLVERRVNLGNTAVAFEALESGSIDVYPEYSGTALGLLGVDREKVHAADATALLRRELERRYGLRWGPPLGFSNSYGIAVRREFAARHQLRTLSDLGRYSRQQALRAAFSHEFLSREDGFRPLAERYRISATPRGTEHGLAFELIASSQTDAIDVYTTEGLILRNDLVVLEDDARFFPAYEAAYLYSRKLSNDPRALTAINDLSGLFDASTMRELNRAVEVDGSSSVKVARRFANRLTESGGARLEARKSLGFFALLVQDRVELFGHLLRHMTLTLLAMCLCLVVGIPLGLWASRSRWGATLALGGTGLLQTIPSLALLVLAIPLVSVLLNPLGQGSRVLEGAALLALFLYSLLPVVRNTKQGLEGVDAAVVEAARGTGLTERQLLLWVELPLASPVILAGVRTAFVITVGTATLAAFVGAGGLGVPIISGLSVQNFNQVWTGAVPAALLALGSDLVFAIAQRGVARRLYGAATQR